MGQTKNKQAAEIEIERRQGGLHQWVVGQGITGSSSSSVAPPSFPLPLSLQHLPIQPPPSNTLREYQAILSTSLADAYVDTDIESELH